MPLIRVDVTHVAGTIIGALPHKRDQKRILKGLGAAARHKWISLAQQSLKSSARDYVAGIQENISDSKVTITLTGMIPNMIEQGWGGGDMRQWLLTGKSAKQGKNGPYAVIPFRHGTPGTGGRNVGHEMPKPIHNAAKKLKHTLTRPGPWVKPGAAGTVAYGERLHPGRKMSAQARKILTTKGKPWHATSIYHGMIRHGKQFSSGRKQTTGYTTFRTISRNSRGEKHWWHPGIKARKLATKVEDHISEIASEIVRSAMSH